MLFSMQFAILPLALLGLSTLAAAAAPRDKCYTATVTVDREHCPPPRPGCFEPQCFRLETATVTAPCPNSKCPATPTVTKKAACERCRTTCPTTTTTVTSSPCPTTSAGGGDSCYTAVTRVSAKGCPPAPTDCVEIQCIQEITVTEPCPNTRCPKTPTSTSTIPCKTACRGGCAIAYTTTKASCSATPQPTVYPTKK